jgi:hypothetical protein
MVAALDRLLEDHNYADTARLLNEKGFRTGDDLPLISIAVGYIRKAYRLKSRFDRLKRETLPPIAWDRTRLGEAQGGSYWSGFEESLAERWVGKRAQDALHR